MSTKTSTESADPDQCTPGNRPFFPAQFRETDPKVKLNSGRDRVRPLQFAIGTRNMAAKYYRA